MQKYEKNTYKIRQAKEEFKKKRKHSPEIFQTKEMGKETNVRVQVN